MRGSQGRRPVGRAVTTIVCLLGSLQAARALTDEEIFRRFQFGFIEPGARALGMGGAYVSLAGDATAAYANPAGLASEVEPHVYLELGYIDNDVATARSRRGSLDVDLVNGTRELPFLSLSSVAEVDSTSTPAFVGMSWPLNLGKGARRLVVAGSRQVLHSHDQPLPAGSGRSEARFSFDTFPNTVSGGQIAAYSIGAPVTGEVSSEIVAWNASASLEVNRDFSVGATLSYAQIDLDGWTRTKVVDPLQILVNSSHPRLPSQPDTDVYRTSVHGSDSRLTYTIGVLWHPGTAFAGGRSPWQFGVSYSKGARFDLAETTTLNGQPDRNFSNRIAVPDQYSVGASYRLREPWLFSGEVERVEYSDLLQNYRAGVSYLTSPHLASGAFNRGAATGIRFRINDGYVYRLGLEYLLPLGGGVNRFALRAGWFRTPDMQFRLAHFNSTDRDVNRAYRKAFPDGDPEGHFTAGGGFERGALSVHLALETSDIGTRVLATYAQRLGGNP